MSLLNRKTIIALFTAIFVSHTVFNYIAWRKKQKRTPKPINEVIIFSEATELVQSKYSIRRSLVAPSTDRILYYLDRARYTLDICMYMLTYKEIGYLLQKLHYRGVKIRFIVDADTAYTNGSETKRLDKKGAIAMRWMKSPNNNMMHHKFCLVDASSNIKDKNVMSFVMTGSLNWTTQGVFGNWESVVVMSEQKVVQEYKQEFERLWLKLAS